MDSVFPAKVGASGPSTKLRWKQLLALFLMVIGFMLLYVDRATLAVANPLIREEMGMSVSEMGLLLSAFLWTNCVMQIPMGPLIDRLQPRIMFYASIALWSLTQLFGGLVQNLSNFFWARILLGVGEAPYAVTCTLATRQWFNIRERGLATGCWSAGSTLGTALSVPLLTFLMLTYSWRWMFIIMGVAGLALALVFFLLFRNPIEVAIAAEDRAYLTDDDSETVNTPMGWRDYKRLFRFKTTWGMAAGWFGPVYVGWLYFTWLPGYLQMDRHITIEKTGWVGAIPFFVGVFGGLLGGRAVDMLVQRGMSPVDTRRYMLLGSMFISGIMTILVTKASSLEVAVLCISISLFMIYVASSVALATPQIIAPRKLTGSLGSIQAFGGYIGSGLAPMLTGFIVQGTGSFQVALYLSAAISFVTPLIYFVLVRKPISQIEIDAMDAKP